MLKRLRVPHTLVLIFAMVVLAWLATFVIPQGAYERTTTADGREMVEPGTYRPLAPHHLSPLVVFTAIPKAFAQSQDIIFFVLIIGGAISVVRATGAVDAAIGLTLTKLSGRRTVLIGAGMALFAIGSNTLGMAEEYLPFVPVLLALCAGLRMDAISAVGIMVVGYGVGYGVAAINPFTVIVAQQIAGLPPTSGLGFRLAITLPFLAIGFHHVLRHSQQVAIDPTRGVPPPAAAQAAAAAHPAPTIAHAVILSLVFGAIALLVWGISTRHWYLEEMGAVFLGLTIATAAVGRLSPDRTAQAFASGATELTMTALLIGVARSIKLVLEEGQIIDSIVHGAAMPLTSLGAYASASGMVLIQSAINLFIPSGSGQAFVTMPIMTPIADLTGVTRQTAVLAFQFGDGFSNMIMPTNPVLVGILGIAGIPYARWLRFILPLLGKFLLASIIAVCLAVAIGYR